MGKLSSNAKSILKTKSQKERKCYPVQWEVNGDIESLDDELIALLVCEQAPNVQESLSLCLF